LNNQQTVVTTSLYVAGKQTYKEIFFEILVKHSLIDIRRLLLLVPNKKPEKIVISYGK